MNGCHNRPPLGAARLVPDGSVTPANAGQQTPPQVHMREIPHTMSTGCQYTLSEAGRVDPGCAGCRWRATP